MSIAPYPPSTTERLATPVSAIMRPGVITISENAPVLHAKRAMVSHGVHAVLVVGATTGQPLGWVSADGLLSWLERDLSALRAGAAITETPSFIAPDSVARAALELLERPGVSRLLVRQAGDGGVAEGVVSPMDLVELVTRP
jgi:CBS domain-containing protein